MPVEPASPEQRAALASVIDRWAALDHPLVTHVEFVAPELVTGGRRWLVRMRGEDKSIITVWLTLGERTLRYETYFVPWPEDPACFEYLLRVNARLYGMKFAIGDEDAIYLMGQVPVRAVDEEAIDEIIGAAYAYTEQYFRTALALGFPSMVAARPLAAG